MHAARWRRSDIYEDNWASTGSTAEEVANNRNGNAPIPMPGGQFATHLFTDPNGAQPGDCKTRCDARMERETNGEYPDRPVDGGTNGDGYNIIGGQFCWAFTLCMIECLAAGGSTYH